MALGRLTMIARCLMSEVHAMKSPSLTTMVPPISVCGLMSRMWRYVGSQTIVPSPMYSGLMADSPVTEPRRALPKKSPTPLTPVVAWMLPAVHCMAPAYSVTPVRPSSWATS